MRVTAKGQITIPKELRDQQGLEPGTEIEVVGTDEGALVRPRPSRSRGRELVASLRDRADGDLGAETVLALTRDEQP